MPLASYKAAERPITPGCYSVKEYSQQHVHVKNHDDRRVKYLYLDSVGEKHWRYVNKSSFWTFYTECDDEECNAHP